MADEQVLFITLAGDLAAWVEEEADRNTRTPSQHVAHLLGRIKESRTYRKAATEERKAKRKALGFVEYRQHLETAAAA